MIDPNITLLRFADKVKTKITNIKITDLEDGTQHIEVEMESTYHLADWFIEASKQLDKIFFEK